MSITVKDKQFSPYIAYAEIQSKIAVMAAQINSDLKDKNPLFVSILNGSFMFTADLLKEITIPCEISFVKLASYHGTQSSGDVKTVIGLDSNISGRNVVILEDIIDTGNTLAAFLPNLKNLNPASVALAALLVKPNALQHPITIDYTCFEIPNDFIVGYGLDYDGYGRNLKDIYKIA